MYSLMIVEDHKLTLEGLTKTMDWGKIGVAVKYQCRNGLEAQEIIKKNHVDIVLTDIKMKGKNGLELTKWINEQSYDIQVVLISAYHDFDYAIEAVNLGAKAYVLKPIEEEILLKTVGKVVEELNQKKVIVAKLQGYNYHTTVNIFKELVCENDVNKEKIRLDLSKANKDYLSDTYLLFAIESMSENIGVSKLRYYINAGWSDVILFDINDFCIGILPIKTSTDIYSVRKKLFNIFTVYTNVHYRSCMGEAVSLEHLDRALNDSLTYMNQCFLLGKEGFNTFDTSILNKNSRYNEKLIDAHEIWSLIKNDDIEGLDNYLKVSKAECITGNYHRDKIIQSIQSTIHDTQNHLDSYALTLEDVYKAQRKSFSYTDKKSLESLFNYLSALFKTIKEVMAQRNIGNIRPIVRSTISKIRKDYSKMSLNLKEVASDLNTNYTYLSKAFKQDIKLSFTKYLNDYRIQKSKVLLKQTDEKVYEISIAVGIDPGHFNYVFRKNAGLSPSEYRRY